MAQSYKQQKVDVVTSLIIILGYDKPLAQYLFKNITMDDQEESIIYNGDDQKLQELICLAEEN